MSFRYKNLTINKLSIIGAGQIGPDILLHFSKVFAGNDVQLVLIDVSESQLQKAKAKIEKKINKGIEIGAFKQAHAEFMLKSIVYSLNYKDISDSQIVLEAATESEEIKEKIFSQVEAICDEQCLFFSNSSHMQPEVIFKNVNNKSRCLVTHYFFPADRNHVVEIIPSGETNPEIVDLFAGFYEAIGKVPIVVKSSYGYAIDPIFEGLCQTAIMCLEKGWGNEKQIDKVACETLGLGVGPFTALNLTGGNPITAHGLDVMHELISPWFKTPQMLHDKVKDKTTWQTALKGEEIIVPEELASNLREEFLGAYFLLSSLIVEKKISNVSDLDMACELALDIKPPFTLMNQIGSWNVLKIATKFNENHSSFKIPEIFQTTVAKGKWNISRIATTVKDNVSILTIRRPKKTNALDSDVMQEIFEHAQKVETDPNLHGLVITGFGTKAFVSGADIGELAACKTPKEGFHNSQHFQSVLNFIENMKKPTVCAYNGFAFGGGNELGMACSFRIAKKDLPIAFCQPEVTLGFIPGAGGTQRLPRLIGLSAAAQILRTGRAVSGKEAVELGFIYKEAEGDLIEEATALIKKIVAREIVPKKISHFPLISNGESPQAINLGHLSKKIDTIICRAIYEGARLNLEAGLRLESELFGECILTRDMKIGVETFMHKGPKVKAEFVNA